MRNPTGNRVRSLTFAALTAALYVIFTLLSAVIGLSGGVIQLRLSEALCVLPAVVPAVFVPGSVAGLTLGCALGNFLTGCAVWDVVFGAFATLLGAAGAAALRRFPYLSWAPTVLSNVLIVPQILVRVYGADEAVWFLLLSVGAGELLSCGGIGILLIPVFRKTLKSFRN